MDSDNVQSLERSYSRSVDKIQQICAQARVRESSSRPVIPPTPFSFSLEYLLAVFLKVVNPSDQVKIKLQRFLRAIQAYSRFLFLTNHALWRTIVFDPSRLIFHPISSLSALLLFFLLQFGGLFVVIWFFVLRVTGIWSYIEPPSEGISFVNKGDPGMFHRYTDNIDKAKRIFSQGVDCPEFILETESEESVEVDFTNRVKHFNIDVAKTLLLFSAAVYERDEELTYEAIVDSHASNSKNDYRKQQQAEARILDLARSWGLEFSGVSDLNTYGGAFAGLWWDTNSNWVVLSFKGPSPINGVEWLDDLTLAKTNAGAFLFGQVHQGFYDTLFPDHRSNVQYSPYGNIVETLKSVAKELKKNGDRKVNVYITGHSLGSAIASVFYARAVKSPEDFGADIKICNAYLYGTPRVGDVDFCAGYYSAVNVPFGKTQTLFRITNRNDLMSRVPISSGDDAFDKHSIFNYGHIGEAVHLTGANKPDFSGNSFAPGSAIRLVQDENRYGYGEGEKNGAGKNGASSGFRASASANLKVIGEEVKLSFSTKNFNIGKAKSALSEIHPVSLAEKLFPTFLTNHLPYKFIANLDKLQADPVVKLA